MFGTIVGSGGGAFAAQEVTDENFDPDAPPREGEKSGRQDVWVTPPTATGGAGPMPNGGNAFNPCGFPRYGELYAGTYTNYRLIRSHPTVSHVRAKVFNTVAGNPWSWAQRDGTPAGRMDFVKGVLDPMRLDLVTNALLSIDFGHSPLEKVWRRARGRWEYDWLKPLAVDTTGILVDRGGRFAGLRFATAGDVRPYDTTEELERTDWIGRTESLLFVNDAEAGDLYGRARHENYRQTAWRDWLDCAQQLMWLAYKIVGKLCVITSPAGTFEAPDGSLHSWKDNCMAAGKAATHPASNNWIWLPSVAMPADRSKEEIDFAKISLVQLDVKDFGTSAPAIMGFIDRMKRDEELMSAGFYQSPRGNMATEGGTKADAGEHLDADKSDMEMVGLRIAMTTQQQAVDDLLEQNYGPEARGSVWPVPAQLADEHQVVDLKVLDAILKHPTLSGQFLEQIDVNALADRRAIAVPKGKTIVLSVVDAADPGGSAGAGSFHDPEKPADDPAKDDDGEED